MRNRKRLIWILVALLLVVLTFRTVLRMSEELSLRSMAGALRRADPAFLALAFAAMLGYIVLEGEALLLILRIFGYPRSQTEGLLYSAGDVYFSAITPSATGGQPASAFFMLRSKIPGAVATVTLLVNLIAYTAATLAVGFFTLLLWPGLFRALGRLPRLLIGSGLAVLTVLVALFYGMLRFGELLYRAGAWGLRLLHRLRLVRDVGAATEKLRAMVEQYKAVARMTHGRRSALLAVFLVDVLQRVSQITVTALVHLALRGDRAVTGWVWASSAFAQIGSNFMPVPGGMGVADFLLLQCFSRFLPREEGLRLELISRSVSFYLCMFLSGLITLAGYLLVRRRARAKAQGTTDTTNHGKG